MWIPPTALLIIFTCLSGTKVANLIKGESSHWINSNDFIPQKFAWQDGFSVFSVSHSMVETVRKYIFNQQEHHRKTTFEEEGNQKFTHLQCCWPCCSQLRA